MNWKLLTGIEFTVIFVICYVSYVNGLTCLYCNHTVPNDCFTKTVSCHDGIEECCFEKEILPDLTTVLTAGCMLKQVCDLIISTYGKRESKRCISCSQCCNSPPNSRQIPCNAYLCEENPDSVCGICHRVSDPKSCSVDRICQPSEICIVRTLFTGGVLKYELGCEEKAICDQILSHYKSTHTTVSSTGKRAEHGDLVLCEACCGGLSCNKDQCSSIIKSQICFNSTICG